MEDKGFAFIKEVSGDDYEGLFSSFFHARYLHFILFDEQEYVVTIDYEYGLCIYLKTGENDYKIIFSKGYPVKNISMDFIKEFLLDLFYYYLSNNDRFEDIVSRIGVSQSKDVTSVIDKKNVTLAFCSEIIYYPDGFMVINISKLRSFQYSFKDSFVFAKYEN